MQDYTYCQLVKSKELEFLLAYHEIMSSRVTVLARLANMREGVNTMNTIYIGKKTILVVVEGTKRNLNKNNEILDSYLI